MTNKEEYAALGRTYCDGCGNSDTDMNIEDEFCYDCLHPEEAARNRRMEMEEYRYVFGDPEDSQ